MRIYSAIVLASIVIVLIQSKRLPKTKRKNSALSYNNGQVTNLSPDTTATKSRTKSINECDVLDMILVLDSSEGVGRGNWHNVLDLAKNIVSWFNVNPDAVSIGVITYSIHAKISIPLGYTGNDVNNLFNNIEYQGDNKDTNAAMEVMQEQFRTYARTNVRRICVLIIYEDEFNSDSKIEFIEWIEVYVIRLTKRSGHKDLVISKIDDPHSPMSSNTQFTKNLICSETAHDMPSNTGGASKMNWSCDFESGNICDMIQDHDKDQFDWTVHTGPTPSETTGPESAYSGVYYAYIEASDPRMPDDIAIMYLPKFNAEGSLCVRFAYNMYGSGIRTLELMKVTPSSAMTPVWLKTGEQGTNWFVESVLVDLGLGDQLLFLAKRGQDHLGDIAIDDVNIKGGACP